MEWLCERCGAPQSTNDSPCENCGHARFEKPYVQRSDGAEDASQTLQWVCEACGRAHPKHSPPCSRCGHMTLEHSEVGVEPSELSAPSYRELVTPLQLAVAIVAAVAAIVLGVGVLGVADVPGVTGAGGPGVAVAPGAPGNATAVDGTALAAVEDDYVAAVNADRSQNDATTVRRTDDLDDLATYYNRWWVRSEYGDDEIPIDEFREHLGSECAGDVVLSPLEVVPAVYQSADPPGEAIGERALERWPEIGRLSADVTGVDVHVAPDGRLYLTQIFC